MPSGKVGQKVSHGSSRRIRILKIPLYDLVGERSCLLMPQFPRKVWETGTLEEFRTEIWTAADMPEILRREF